MYKSNHLAFRLRSILSVLLTVMFSYIAYTNFGKYSLILVPIGIYIGHYVTWAYYKDYANREKSTQ